MRKPPKSHLFSLAEEESLAQKVHAFDLAFLHSLFAPSVLARGQNYFHNDWVTKVQYEASRIKAEIVGSELYETQLFLQEKEVYYTCDCPFGGACKHLAALLIYLKHTATSEELQQVEKALDASIGSTFDQYLQQLSHAELVELVKTFAPSQFHKAIRIQLADQATQERVLKKAQDNIQELFSQQHYDIEYFEESLNEILAPLRGLWSIFPKKITAIFTTIIRSVNDCFENGQLYEDYSDYAYEGLDLGVYMAEFINAIPLAERAEALLLIWEEINQMGYFTFTNFLEELLNRWTKEEDVLFLRDFLLAHDFWLSSDQRIINRLYQRISPFLDFSSKKIIVEKLAQYDSSFIVPWINILEDEDQIEIAIDILDEKIKNLENDFYKEKTLKDIFEKRIAFEKEHRKNKALNILLQSYIHHLPSPQSLKKALTLMPQKATEWESQLEILDPIQYAVFLEEQGRLEEIPAIFKKHKIEDYYGQSFIYEFYQRHQAFFPQLALSYYIQLLEKELTSTGDYHYQRVATFLHNIQSLESEESFSQRLDDIKTKYYRRRNLMQILRRSNL